MAAALETAVSAGEQIVIVGERGQADTRAMWLAANTAYRPFTVMVLVDNNRFSPTDQALTLAALVIILGVFLSLFLLAEPLSRRLGGAGSSVLRRIMGLLLTALAINLVLTAISKQIE